MFGVLVIVLCSDRVADLRFSAGERQIPFIVFFAHFENLSTRGGRHPVSTASSAQQMTLPVRVGAPQ